MSFSLYEENLLVLKYSVSNKLNILNVRVQIKKLILDLLERYIPVFFRAMSYHIFPLGTQPILFLSGLDFTPGLLQKRVPRAIRYFSTRLHARGDRTWALMKAS